jgi:RNA polymerase-binding transcription factor DksA
MMTEAQRQHFERRLLEERAYALDLLNRSTTAAATEDEQDRAGDLSKMPTHMADRGTDTIDEEVAASNATRLSRELAEIDAALERLHTTPERYGICEDTGRPIPLERLEIIPWARTCQ